MNSIILKVIAEGVIFFASVISAVKCFKKDDKKSKDWAWLIISIIVAVASLMAALFANTVPDPLIERRSDYSAVVLSTKEPMNIEYKISTNTSSEDEWIKYEEC